MPKCFAAWCVVTLLAKGRDRPAVRLCAAAAHLRQTAGAPLPPPEREAFEQDIRQLQTVLGQSTFSREWELGTGLSQEEVIALALTSLSDPLKR